MKSLVRYAALLRGVSPMNCKMPALKSAFEAAGFEDVKTVISSGNVLFSAPATAPEKLAKKAEATMSRELPRTFLTIVEPVEEARALIEADPWTAHALPEGAKRIVTFLRATPERAAPLPVTRDGATIYAIEERRVFSAYVNRDKGPVFMTLLLKTFGEEITTRTWDTVRRLAR